MSKNKDIDEMYEFDEEYIAELKAMAAPIPIDNTPLMTVANEEDYEKKHAAATLECATHNAAVDQQRKKFYTQSEIPVRPCTADCKRRKTCKDFKDGRVSDLDLCRPELRQIKKWQVAFRSGNVDMLKDDVGAVAGSLMTLVSRLLDQVIDQGVTIEQQKVSASGDKYTETIEHPGLKRIESICKSLNIDLNSYLMTPKASKDAGPTIHMHVGVSAEEVQQRFAARYVGGGPAEEVPKVGKKSNNVD